jgi:hypothetical protein
MAVCGLRRLKYIGFTAPELEEPSRFRVDVRGCEHLYSLGPLASDHDDWMTEHLNVSPRKKVRENRFSRCGGQAVCKAFDHQAPDPATTPLKNSDIGCQRFVGGHICRTRAELARHPAIFAEPS